MLTRIALRPGAQQSHSALALVTAHHAVARKQAVHNKSMSSSPSQHRSETRLIGRTSPLLSPNLIEQSGEANVFSWMVWKPQYAGVCNKDRSTSLRMQCYSTFP
eukprot:1891332-Rhodomonas_salina.1